MKREEIEFLPVNSFINEDHLTLLDAEWAAFLPKFSCVNNTNDLKKHTYIYIEP